MIIYKATKQMQEGKSIFKLYDYKQYGLSDEVANDNGYGTLDLLNYLHPSDNDLESDINDFMKLNKITDINSILILNKPLIHTLFHETVKKDKKFETLDFLINKQNLNINAQDKKYFNNTVLMLYVANGEVKKPLKLINDFNADPFIPDECGKNSLHFIIAKGHKGTSSLNDFENQLNLFNKILLSKNIKNHINDQDDFGNTAAHIAAAKRDMDYLRPLIETGADLEIKNKNGLSVIDVLKKSSEDRYLVLISIMSADKELYNALDSSKDRASILKAWGKSSGVVTFDLERFEQDPLPLLSKIEELKNARNKSFEEENNDIIKIITTQLPELDKNREQEQEQNKGQKQESDNVIPNIVDIKKTQNVVNSTDTIIQTADLSQDNSKEESKLNNQYNHNSNTANAGMGAQANTPKKDTNSGKAKYIVPIVCIAATATALIVLQFALALLTLEIGLGVGLSGAFLAVASHFILKNCEQKNINNQPPTICK